MYKRQVDERTPRVRAAGGLECGRIGRIELQRHGHGCLQAFADGAQHSRLVEARNAHVDVQDRGACLDLPDGFGDDEVIGAIDERFFEPWLDVYKRQLLRCPVA